MSFGKKKPNQRKLKVENTKWKNIIAMNILHLNPRIIGPLRSFPTKSNLWISFTCHCVKGISCLPPKLGKQWSFTEK